MDKERQTDIGDTESKEENKWQNNTQCDMYDKDNKPGQVMDKCYGWQIEETFLKQ
jgi:hypothetical protein